MKVELEDVPLPDNWEQKFHGRGNTGWAACLRDIPLGKSFTYEVNNERELKEFNNLRAAISQLKLAKMGRRNFVIRLVEDEEIKDEKTGESLSRKLYRVWAAPFPMEINNGKSTTPATNKK